MLLAVPVGIVGGALAAVLISMGIALKGSLSGESIQWNVFGSIDTLWPISETGSVIGLVMFPIAYASVARTNSVWSIVPAGLLATVLGAWIGWESLAALTGFYSRHLSYGAIVGLIIYAADIILAVLPVIAMFGACAWAAARERRIISGRP